MDDEEYGAGKKLLDLLREAEIFYRVVYVVRYYGGTHLNNDRFVAYKEAAVSAINHYSLNTVLNVTQTPYPVHNTNTRREKNTDEGTSTLQPTTHITDEQWAAYHNTLVQQGILKMTTPPAVLPLRNGPTPIRGPAPITTQSQSPTPV